MKTSLFLENVITIDSAVFFPLERPFGKTWTVDCYCSGELDNQGMLIDFGILKEVFRDKIHAELDHRIICNEKYLNQISAENSKLSYRNSDFKAPHSFFSALPDDVFRRDGFEEKLSRWIEHKAKPHLPKSVRELKVSLRPLSVTNYNQNEFAFSYMHFLQFHAGKCQKMHGHSSRVKTNEPLSAKTLSLIHNMNEKVLLAKDYVVQKEGAVKLKYSCDLGTIEASLPTEFCYVTPFETTIENISRNFYTEACKIDALSGCTFFEGLGKGASVCRE